MGGSQACKEVWRELFNTFETFPQENYGDLAMCATD